MPGLKDTIKSAANLKMGLVVLTAENGTEYIPAKARVYNPNPNLDKVLKITLASGGFKNITITRKFDADTTTSFVTHPASVNRGRVVTPLDAPFDATVLASLAPHAKLRVSSLMQMFPETRWKHDGGGRAIDWGKEVGDHISSVGFESHADHTRRVKSQSREVQTVKFHLGIISGVITKGIVRSSSQVKYVDGVRLQEGDTVQDAEGVRWYFQNGALRDRISVTMQTRSLKVLNEGRALGPRSQLTKQPSEYSPGARFAVTLVWPDGLQVVFPCTAFSSVGDYGVAWGWYIEDLFPTVEHPFGLCQTTHGVALDYATPELCLKGGGTWDRPCKLDTECPFYDARRGRGGCDKGGHCEMPLGVDRKSFRHAGDTSQMMHLGCDESDPNFPWCAPSPRNARF